MPLRALCYYEVLNKKYRLIISIPRNDRGDQSFL